MSFEPEFSSRRSDVRALRGIVATSQPLAARAGLRALEDGGNVADAAVTAAAVMAVVEPVSCGLGGDAFALVHKASSGEVTALNGSGRSPAAASAEELLRLMYRKMPKFTAHTVTVPGAVAAWADLLRRHGTFELARALAPAIDVAEEGWPVTDWIAAGWARQEAKLRRDPGWESGDFTNGPPQESGGELLLDGRAPRPGEVMRVPTLAKTLREIAEGGPDAFYRGAFARRAAEHVQRYGGWLAEADLAEHESDWTEPITAEYRGATLYECPPNGQGLAAIVAAEALDRLDVGRMGEADRVHQSVLAMRHGFTEAFARVADPGFAGRGDDTVYLSVADGDGNAVSFIQSLYMGTGTGLVVPGTGVSLQNRGAGFVLDGRHPNRLEPGKRPYHTIIPALTRRDGALHACFGVMGGFMQPQGHVQMLVNLLDRGMTPQSALDAPRWRIGIEQSKSGACAPGDTLWLEEGFAPETYSALAERGHRVKVSNGFERIHMGGGQVIVRDPATGALAAGSDPRKDGCAMGY